VGVTAPSTAAEKQGRSEPGAGGVARGPRVPVRKSGKNKKKRRGWYKIIRQSRPVRMVGRRLPRRAKRLLKAARKWQRERADRLRFRWRRSLQLRVVTTTLALSALVIAVLGFFLTQQISDGLLLNKEKSATAQLSQGLTVAESNANLNKEPTSTAIANNYLYPTAQELQDASGDNSSYIVIIEVSPQQVHSVYTGGVAGGADPGASIPSALSASVEAEQKHDGTSKVYYAPTTIVSTLGRGDQPGLAVGTPLGNYYQLYYLFPMVQEQQTLSLVQRTLVGAGLALIVLLGLIASLVTRWVVIPVRHAAQAAQRLSAGRLGERMQVRGADDLAALATSFNDMAASLQDKLRELEELSQLQRQFVSDVSHELRTPLTTIKMAADVLLEAKDSFDPAGARSAELLEGQLDRFQSLLEDLLEISRYDANAATLDADSVDISDIARRAADDAQQLAERRGSRIEFRLPAEPCMADADHRRVERILRNLLVNAVEHSEGNDVIVTVAGDRDAIAVAVRDHGVGLKPGQEQLVFDRFWRADPARARTTGGTGLGLAIALEDAQLHGGWLQAWGMPGKGSVFRLTIPRTAGQKLVGSPLPLVPDDTDAITALGEIMPGGLLLPGQLSPPPSQPAVNAATDDARATTVANKTAVADKTVVADKAAVADKTTGTSGSSGTGVGSRG
jgi:two-component system, OmpR family, sensor histidine kinase MtrB